MVDETTDMWDEYLKHAREYLRNGSLEDDELGYKRELGGALSETREKVLANADEWPKLLKSALGKGNVIDWRDVDDFNRWCTNHQDEALNALCSIWTKEDLPVGERVRAFSDAMPREVKSGPGTRMSLISGLLMALDNEQYPPFQITTFREAYTRTGYDEPNRDADEATLYIHALGFLDRFIEEAKRQGLTVNNRLEAQSIVWRIKDVTVSPNDPVPLVTVPTDIEKLAKSLHLTEPDGFLEEIELLLRSQKQVIFQGPPGTGKTYVALQLANHLAGSEDRVTLVQFHPSYAYEDFVRGFRPRLNDGNARYELRDGPLLKAAERARKEPDIQHFLVIDEINRGNIAKVFGELYFLLEYREELITLQYQRDNDETFSLPKNLYIIGTMNTADRSIALVDLALRRRFSFVEFHPDEEPVKGVLRRWLIDNGKSELLWLANVVELVNEKLRDDRHAAIGPSYFMPRNLDLDERAVERIWKHNVIPYIEERRFGDENVREEFDLSKLRGISETDGDPTEEDSDAPAIGNGDGDGAD